MSSTGVSATSAPATTLAADSTERSTPAKPADKKASEQAKKICTCTKFDEKGKKTLTPLAIGGIVAAVVVVAAGIGLGVGFGTGAIKMPTRAPAA